MNTQTITEVDFNPFELADVTYTLVIDERQLHYIRRALREFVANNPDEELDEYGQDIPTVLEEMLTEWLPPSPMINSFVL